MNKLVAKHKKMIKVIITHEEWNYSAKPDEQKDLDDLVNELLQPIILDCTAFSAKVNAIRTLSGNYRIEPKCDDYSTLSRMIDLLPAVLPIP